MMILILKLNYFGRRDILWCDRESAVAEKQST